MPDHAEVFDSEGRSVATVESVLSDEASDIFHGLAVRLHGASNTVELSAEQVERVTAEGVRSSLTASQMKELPALNAGRWNLGDLLGRDRDVGRDRDEGSKGGA